MRGLLARSRHGLATALRRGHRTVLLSLPGLRLGNLLYFWLRADARQQAGDDYRVLWTPEASPWLDVFPLVARRLLVDPDEVGWLDRREHVAEGTFFQRFGSDFSRLELTGFVERYLLSAPALVDGLDQHVPDPHLVTVNVRRGDYLAPPNAKAYGFDVQLYLEQALDGSRLTGGAIDHIHVVSDDPVWCRNHLASLSDHAGRVTFSGTTDGPLVNFLELALSQRLVLANSTFSYWGGYVSNAVHRDNHAQVWVPRFHSRLHASGRAWQLDDRWSVVEGLPGGW